MPEGFIAPPDTAFVERRGSVTESELPYDQSETDMTMMHFTLSVLKKHSTKVAVNDARSQWTAEWHQTLAPPCRRPSG